jgi:hypothetical protein
MNFNIGGSIMKFLAAVLLAAGSLLGTGSAFATTADDISWIARCMSDNKSEQGVSVDIAFKYCKCMNNKMSENETQSISTWEKSHPNEMKACDTEAGWK